MNVVLIGFRCAGKTSVGGGLARRLNRELIDCDEYIIKKTGLEIREIFDIAGESYFRMLEGDAIADLSKLDHRVIATGGGAALKYKNIRNLKRNGILMYLDASLQIVLDRMQRDPLSDRRRPPLTDVDQATEVKEQLQFRHPYYLNAADHVVQTDQRSVEEIVIEIVGFLKERGILPFDKDHREDSGGQDEAIA